MSYLEKRVDERVDVKTNAKFKILSDTDGAISNGYEQGATRNISKGGLCIQVNRKLTEGNVIRVEIPTPENVERTIKAFCEVQWCVKNANNSDFEAGLSFIALKEEDVDYLESLVEKQKRVM
jgi:hypothetical protein